MRIVNAAHAIEVSIAATSVASELWHGEARIRTARQGMARRDAVTYWVYENRRASGHQSRVHLGDCPTATRGKGYDEPGHRRHNQTPATGLIDRSPLENSQFRDSADSQRAGHR